MEGVGQYLAYPDEAGLHVLQKKQVHGTKQQSADADGKPDLRRMAHKTGCIGVRLEYAEQGRVGKQQQW